VIRVRGLSKRYGDFQAISRVSFDVEEGEIFGFIGPNGAGKTTTIRILATLMLPSAGSARILGWDVTEHPEKVRSALGYMPDRWGVYPDITVAEYLEFFAAAYGTPRRERAKVIGGVMELTDLTALRERLVEALSKGMKQRLCLAKTLIHDPRLLLLDEPADGLDPRARIELRELLRELAAMGKTIVISSHILTELSDLVTSVGIVEQGRLVMAGEVGTIIERLTGEDDGDEGDGFAGEDGEDDGDQGRDPDGGEDGGEDGDEDGEGVDEDGERAPRPVRRRRAGVLQRFVLRVDASSRASAEELLLARPELTAVAGVSEREVRFSYRGAEDDVAGVVRELVQGGVGVVGLRPDRADLEDVFMAVTRGQVQ
jgi:ABC-2 type transport system ATP-binding protein